MQVHCLGQKLYLLKRHEMVKWRELITIQYTAIAWIVSPVSLHVYCCRILANALEYCTLSAGLCGIVQHFVETDYLIEADCLCSWTQGRQGVWKKKLEVFVISDLHSASLVWCGMGAVFFSPSHPSTLHSKEGEKKLLYTSPTSITRLLNCSPMAQAGSSTRAELIIAQ